jgi:hypothetical protein
MYETTYKLIIIGGSNTVTVKFNQAACHRAVCSLEYRGAKYYQSAGREGGSDSRTVVLPHLIQRLN